MILVGVDPHAKQHPDCSAVWVSPNGQVLRRINEGHPERRQWMEYSPHSDKDGYLCLRVNMGQKWRIHRLVYSLFVGPLVAGQVICHIDGNILNNHFSNLLQASQLENISHKRLHGTHQIGERHPRSKMTNTQAAEVKKALESAARYETGRLQRGEAGRISEELGVSIHTVRDMSARSKTAWSFVA